MSRISKTIKVILIFSLAFTASLQADSAKEKEYKVKAAFIYNFLKFIDWPEQKYEDTNSPVIIAIIGEDPFGDVIDKLKGKSVNDREIIIKRFKSWPKEIDPENPGPQAREIAKSNIVFVSTSMRENYKDIAVMLRRYNVLTISEDYDFLSKNGVINFLTVDGKIRFEVNMDSVEKSGLKISSKLLKLAIRVLSEGEEMGRGINMPKKEKWLCWLM